MKADVDNALKVDVAYAYFISRIKEATLMPGTNCHVWKAIGALAREMHDNGYSAIARIRGRFRDAVGNSYVSRPFSFNVDGWIAGS